MRWPSPPLPPVTNATVPRSSIASSSRSAWRQPASTVAGHPRAPLERLSSPIARALLRLDVGTLHVVEVLALDANEADGSFAIGRVHVANIVKMGITGVHGVGFEGLDQGRLVA